MIDKRNVYCRILALDGAPVPTVEPSPTPGYFRVVFRGETIMDGFSSVTAARTWIDRNQK